MSTISPVPAMAPAPTTPSLCGDGKDPSSIPTEFADFAFEYKLGWRDACDRVTNCPIKPYHVMAESRRAAWKAGRNQHRKSLGLRVHGLSPLQLTRRVLDEL